MSAIRPLSLKLMRLIFVAPDEFGKTVQSRLAELLKEKVISPLDELSRLGETLGEAQCVVFAAEHVDVSACGFVDDMTWRESKYLITASLTGLSLRVGPMIVPGSSACWNCYAARERQHAMSPSTQVNQPEGTPNLPPHLLEPIAQMAAARIASVLATSAEVHRNGGCIWDRNLYSEHIQLSKVVGRHGCPRCGLQRPVQSLSTAALLADCSDLWNPVDIPAGIADATEPQLQSGTP